MAYPQEILFEIDGPQYAGRVEITDVLVRRVDEVPWSDVEMVFGTRGDPSTCWCQFYKLTDTSIEVIGGAACATLLLGQVRDAQRAKGPTPGLVAYADGVPVGWVAVEPRPNYPAALRGRVVAGGSPEAPDDASVWAIVCFVVRVGYRRKGVATALIGAAVEHARERGARIVEGYPVDVAVKPKVSSAELYHGTVSLFEAAGFVVTSRPSSGRAILTFRM